MSTACVFRHFGLHLVSAVHGDDFITAGPKSGLDQFVQKLKAKNELKEAARLGPSFDDHEETWDCNEIGMGMCMEMK